MIIIGVDERNLFLAVDVLQAKMLVEVLRDLEERSEWGSMIHSSQVLNIKGFTSIMANDVRNVLGSFAGVMGFWTDRVEKRKEEPPTPAAPDAPESEEPPATNPPAKPYVM